MSSLILVSIQLVFLATAINAWHKTVKFNFTVNDISDSHVNVFESSYLENDYFSMISSNRNNHMDMDSQSVYIGGRNHLYQLGLPDLEHQSNLSWASSGFNVMQCLNRSIIRNKDECANYIKLYLKLDEDTFQVCSTNALSPKCRFYQLKKKQSEHMSRFLRRKADRPSNENSLSRAVFLNETSGLGYSPLKAHENKYVYNRIQQKNFLFTANTIDLNRYFTSINRYTKQEQIATNVNDDGWINRAEFVDSFNTDERVFFLFNEETKTERSQPHDGLAIKQNVATISQICLNDPGAPLNSLRNIWTSYLKSRLNCVYDASKANDIEFDSVFQSNSKLFYFNEIKSMSQLYTTKVPGSSKTTSYFYAVFTTSKYSVTASAICKFSLEQIMQSFHGDYKHRQSSSPIPNPRPSHCPNKLTYQHLVFSRKHILMENSVESEALIVETSQNNRFMSLDVDYQVSNYNEKSKSDVILVGTDNGKVLSFVIQTQSNTPTLVHSEEINVLSPVKTKLNQNALVNIKLYKRNEQKTLILMTRNKLISMPASYCKQKLNVSQCDNQIYPYCVWSNKSSKCIEYTSSFVNEMHVASASRIQNLTKTVNTSLFDSTRKIQEPNRYTSVPLDSSKDNLLVEEEDINVRVNAAKEIQFTLDLGTLICLAFVFVAVSAVIGSAFTVLFIKCFRSKRQQFKLKQLNLSSFFSKKSLADLSSTSSEEPIDKFENLYSKVKPKKRSSMLSHVDVRTSPSESNNLNMAPEGSNYSAITELITQQYHTEPARYVSMMATSEIQPYSTQGEVMISESNNNNNNNMCFLNNRFLDYDDSEYFTIKKPHLDNQNNLRISSSDSASTSSVSSGSGSGQTQSSIQSTALLVKSQKSTTVLPNQRIYERYMPSPPIYSITNNMAGDSHLGKYYL